MINILQCVSISLLESFVGIFWNSLDSSKKIPKKEKKV